MASADKYGIFDEKCISLAHLHSNAVDFPKSGASVKVPPELIAYEYPAFMQKAKNRKVYIYK